MGRRKVKGVRVGNREERRKKESREIVRQKKKGNF